MGPTDTIGDDVRLWRGDCLDVLPCLEAASVDAVVTDPPYELGFMGKAWDRTGVAFNLDVWRAVLQVVKPGGYMLAFGGTRTYHRMTCAIEDAGWEIRDCLNWLYGTGFPKGQGCLKPAWEPILLAREPGPKVLPLGVDGCRVPTRETLSIGSATPGGSFRDDAYQWGGDRPREQHPAGRYPANVAHDGSDEVLEAFAAFGDRGNLNTYGGKRTNDRTKYGAFTGEAGEVPKAIDPPGTAARFFYCAKASKSERGAGNAHPTVKPLALMRWLVRLVTPDGGTVLDPFVGSGTTGLACLQTGRKFIGIELDPAHYETARKRLLAATGGAPDQLFSGVV